MQENIGRAAPGRTYEDLLTSAHDEALFEYYFTSQIARADVATSDPDDADAYDRAAPYWHCYLGLERYWRKRLEAIGAEADA